MTTSQQSRLGFAPEEGMKAPVVTISSGQETLFDIGQSIAGVVIADLDRVAINAQTDPLENGIYKARGGKSWERSTDFNNGEDVINGQLMTDANTSAVYALSVPSAGWTPGLNSVSFGLLLSPVGFFWGAITGTLSNQADLQLELDAKAALVHTHVEADITDLQSYSLVGHTHVEADITDLQAYSLPGHTHTEAEISDLQLYITDAPGSIANDGLLYARFNNVWAPFSTASGNVGEIVAWAADDVPDNFLDCNGQSVNAVTFNQLFAIIGFQYGGSGANFNLPDLRGQFIRGRAGGSGADPDRTSRTDRGDGVTGDRVGTKQANSRASTGPIGHPSGSTGGQEDRPINVYMNFIIRYAGGGSGNLPPEVAVQNNGITLTTAVQLLNFVNFALTEPVTDQIDITFGVATANGIYNPGYTSYTQIDDDEFTVDQIDAFNLFYVGRRLRFTDIGGNFTFGNIAFRDFDTTETNDTYVLMSMDSGDTVPTPINTVELISSDTQWSPIPLDPFGGTAIRGIIVGSIAAVTYLFAVGDLGKAGWSTDGGLTWTMLVTGTTEHLNVCQFDSINEHFWAGGQLGVLVRWDGTVVVLDTTSIPSPGLATTGDGRINGFSYDSGADALIILYQRLSTPTWHTATSDDQGATWLNRASLGNISEGFNNLRAFVALGGATGPVHRAITLLNTGDRFISTWDDTSFATGPNMAPHVAAQSFLFDDGDQSVHMLASFDGSISGESQWVGLDDVTFVNPVRDFAYSVVHSRLVMVGDNQQIGTLEEAEQDAADAWVPAQNGFDPLANIKGVEWDSFNANFCAVADNGQICRSTNGLGELIVIIPTIHTGFTLSADSPFGVANIVQVIAGTIGLTNYWQIIGGGGKVAYSTNAGVNWTLATTPSTAGCLSIAYDGGNEQFVIGLTGGEIWRSSDGTTWTQDITSIAALGEVGTNDIDFMVFEEQSNLWWVELSRLTDHIYYSAPGPLTGTPTWTFFDSSTPNMNLGVKAQWTDDLTPLLGGSGAILFAQNQDIANYLIATDTTDSIVFNNPLGIAIDAFHGSTGTGGQFGDIMIGFPPGTIQLVDNVLTRDFGQVFTGDVKGFSFNAGRWIAIGDLAEIFTITSAQLTNSSWEVVTNPFTGNLTDLFFDTVDNQFIVVSANGEIGFSADGIS